MAQFTNHSSLYLLQQQETILRYKPFSSLFFVSTLTSAAALLAM